MTQQKKILVIGPTMLDIQVFLANIEKKEITTDFCIGGKGYNVAQGVKLFDLPVVFSTMYGDGEVGRYMYHNLKNSGIELLESNHIPHEGGLFVGVHDKNGDTILDKADNSLFEHQKLERVNFNEISTVLVLSSTNDTIFNTLMKAKLDFPDLKLCLEIAGRKSIEYIRQFLPSFDFIIANRIETYSLLDISEQSNLEDEINIFTMQNQNILITTIDKDGVIVSEKGVSTIIPIHNIPEPIVSTVGAGDSVTASIISLHYGYGKPLIESVQQAMIVASHTIRSKEPFLQNLPINV